MIRQPISQRARILFGISSVLLLLLFYALLSWRQHAANPKDTTVPNLSQFVEGWKQMLAPRVKAPAEGEERPWLLVRAWNACWSTWLVGDVWATYSRLFYGMLAGVAIAFAVGMAMGCFAQAEAFFLPPLNFFAKIPPTAMLAVYFILVGTGMSLYVAMIALGVFPILAQSIYQAVRKDVDDHAVCKAYTLGASNMEVMWNVIVKQILPRILESVRLQIGPAMVFLVAAEFAVGGDGVGYRLRIQSRILQMNVVYTYLAVLGGSGLLLDWGMNTLRKKLCPWFGE